VLPSVAQNSRDPRPYPSAISAPNKTSEERGRIVAARKETAKRERRVSICNPIASTSALLIRTLGIKKSKSSSAP
jgi:hypothetical protein